MTLEEQLTKAKQQQRQVFDELFTCSKEQVIALENTIDVWTQAIDYIATMIMERDNAKTNSDQPS